MAVKNFLSTVGIMDGTKYNFYVIIGYVLAVLFIILLLKCLYDIIVEAKEDLTLQTAGVESSAQNSSGATLHTQSNIDLGNPNKYGKSPEEVMKNEPETFTVNKHINTSRRSGMQNQDEDRIKLPKRLC